jgi:hypothetical protein
VTAVLLNHASGSVDAPTSTEHTITHTYLWYSPPLSASTQRPQQACYWVFQAPCLNPKFQRSTAAACHSAGAAQQQTAQH